ncbi:hypothetical protein D3C78_1602750 [compost metagenome]
MVGQGGVGLGAHLGQEGGAVAGDDGLHPGEGEVETGLLGDLAVGLAGEVHRRHQGPRAVQGAGVGLGANLNQHLGHSAILLERGGTWVG